MYVDVYETVASSIPSLLSVIAALTSDLFDNPHAHTHNTLRKGCHARTTHRAALCAVHGDGAIHGEVCVRSNRRRARASATRGRSMDELGLGVGQRRLIDS